MFKNMCLLQIHQIQTHMRKSTKSRSDMRMIRSGRRGKRRKRGKSKNTVQSMEALRPASTPHPELHAHRI